MEWVEILLREWGVISQAPIAFILIAGIFLAVGYFFSKQQSSERIAILEARIKLRDEERPKPVAMAFQDHVESTSRGPVYSTGQGHWEADAANGTWFVHTMTGYCLFLPPKNLQEGALLKFEFVQDLIGDHFLSFEAHIVLSEAAIIESQGAPYERKIFLADVVAGPKLRLLSAHLQKKGH